MKYLLIVLCLVFTSLTLRGQVDSLNNSSLENYVFDLKKERLLEFQSYVDSLNNYTSGEAIPRFILDECFDNRRYLWLNPHEGMSLRWKVLEKTSNKEALRQILATKDIRLKRKCSFKEEQTTWIDIKIPLINKSYWQLIKRRYRQLK